MTSIYLGWEDADAISPSIIKDSKDQQHKQNERSREAAAAAALAFPNSATPLPSHNQSRREHFQERAMSKELPLAAGSPEARKRRTDLLLRDPPETKSPGIGGEPTFAGARRRRWERMRELLASDLRERERESFREREGRFRERKGGGGLLR